MVYGLREHKRGFLVGDYGIGKAFLTRALIKEVPSTFCLSGVGLIEEIIYQLVGSFLSPKEVSKPEFLHTLSQRAEENYYKQGLYSEALTHKRPYRRAFPPTEAIKIILSISYKVSRTFLERISLYPKGTRGELNTKGKLCFT